MERGLSETVELAELHQLCKEPRLAKTHRQGWASRGGCARWLLQTPALVGRRSSLRTTHVLVLLLLSRCCPVAAVVAAELMMAIEVPIT